MANNEDVPVGVTVRSGTTTKSFPAVAPDKKAFHAFTTRQATVPAGGVTVQASVVVDGETVSVTKEVPYDGIACDSPSAISMARPPSKGRAIVLSTVPPGFAGFADHLRAPTPDCPIQRGFDQRSGVSEPAGQRPAPVYQRSCTSGRIRRS